jgi:hypothetical protein
VITRGSSDGLNDSEFNNISGLISITKVNFGIRLGGITPSTFNNSAAIIVENLLPNPSFLIYRIGIFINNSGGSVNGAGVINLDVPFMNYGGLIEPNSFDFGVDGFGEMTFNNDEDFTQSTLGIYISDDDDDDDDIVSDYLDIQGIATLGRTLDLSINFPNTPVQGEVITFFSAQELIGEFNLTSALPTNWGILYNFPNQGDVSLEYGAINSLQSGLFSNPNTWASGVVPDADSPAIVNMGHTATLDVPAIEVGRFEISQTATVIVPTLSELMISNSQGPAVINNGTLQMDGVLSIDNSESDGIVNSGTINLTGQITVNNSANGIINNDIFIIDTNATVDVMNSREVGIMNSGNYLLNDSAILNIDTAPIRIINANVLRLMRMAYWI